MTCSDYDECSDIRACQQHCTNTKGSYKCGCEAGFMLEADSRQCRVVGPSDPRMLYAVDNNINAVVVRADSSYRIEQKLTTHATPIRSFALSLASGELFWSSPALGVIGKFGLNTAPSSGSKNEVWLSNVHEPEKVAVDWVTGNLYYSEQRDSCIHVCSENGASEAQCAVVVENVPKDTITQLAVDPRAGMMFVAGYSERQGAYPRGAVYPFTMDGRSVEDAEIIGADKTGIPSGLALDPVTRRVYWSDLTSRDISVCTYQGRDCRVIAVSNQPHPAHLAFFQGSLFWTTGTLGTVHSHNIVTGQSSLRMELTLPPMSHSIKFAHPSLQLPILTNPCPALSCSSLCLLTGPGQARCACAAGSRPQDPNQVNCIPDALLAGSVRAIPVVNLTVQSEGEVEVQRVESGGLGGQVGTVLGVGVVLLLALVGIIVFLVLKSRRNKKGSEGEMRLSEMAEVSDWVTGPRLGQHSSKASAATMKEYNPSNPTNAMPSVMQAHDWLESPAVDLRKKGLDADSRASSMTSLEEEDGSYDVHKDKTRLL